MSDSSACHLTLHMRSGQDLLVPLPLQQYAFCHYRWTPDEQASYLRLQRPPHNASTLSPATPVLLVAFQSQVCTSSACGPTLPCAKFELMDDPNRPRCIFAWDLGGPDSANEPLFPAIIPSEDIQPTKTQKAHYQLTARGLDHNGRRTHPRNLAVPSLTALLATRMIASDYAEHVGPLIYDRRGCDWSLVMGVLRQFLGERAFRYPARGGQMRDPGHYVHPLRSFSQWWHTKRYHRMTLDH